MSRVPHIKPWPPVSRSISLLMVIGSLACASETVAPKATRAHELVEAASTVDPAVATTGDIIDYEVVINHRAGIQIALPELGSKIAGFRIIDFGRDEPKEEGDRIIHRLWYQLRGDLVGSYVLPAVTVSYRDPEQGDAPEKSVTTSEIFVEIQSVLPTDGSATDIRPLKKLRQVETTPPWALFSLIALAALLIIAGFLIYRRQSRKEIILPTPPPHEIAFDALDNLRQTDFDDPRAVRRYYFSISKVVRTYIEGRFELNATDLTTEELLPTLMHSPDLNNDQRQGLATFLNTTDGVKFAAQTPTTADIESVHETALSFVEQTYLRPEVTEQGGRAHE